MRVLFVAALPEESAGIKGRGSVLHVGIGKVQAAVTLAHHLAEHAADLDLVVNVGSAGSLSGHEHGEVVEVGVVEQHDLPLEAMSTFLDRELPGGPITLTGPDGASARLATGDHLVLDPDERAQLAQRADLVDMEGYAVAATCARFDVPVWLIKCVSDNADTQAVTTWPLTVELVAGNLARWAEDRGLLA